MLRLGVFCCLLAIGHGAALNVQPEGRIIGGDDATIDDFPFMLALYHKTEFICGATIINEVYALTSARCVYGKRYNELYIISGSTTRARQAHDCNGFYVYPYFREKVDGNDVAVLRVKQPFPVTGRVTLSFPRPTGTQLAIIVGWGLTKEEGAAPSTNLLVGDVAVSLQTTCKIAHYPGLVITDTMFCAEGDEVPPATVPKVEEPSVIGTCDGDLGGPLLIASTEPVIYSQVGVAIRGQGCGRKGLPSVFTDISETRIRAWIQRYLPRL